MLKTLVLILTIFCSWNLIAGSIIIDPGHGGKDCGAKTKIWTSKKKLQMVCEKDITLSISKYLHKELKKYFKQVYLTRTLDRDISLEERANLADKISADIFISVHVNSGRHKSSNGVETFYLDNHKDKAVARVEEVENRTLKGKNKIVNQILIDLVIERTAPESKKLSNYIHRQLKNKAIKPYKLKDRGIKPALFYVLALSKRPAVLVEAGFMSNPKEKKVIMTKEYQKAYAKGIALGIRKYFKSKRKKKAPSLFKTSSNLEKSRGFSKTY